MSTKSNEIDSPVNSGHQCGDRQSLVLGQPFGPPHRILAATHSAHTPSYIDVVLVIVSYQEAGLWFTTTARRLCCGCPGRDRCSPTIRRNNECRPITQRIRASLSHLTSHPSPLSLFSIGLETRFCVAFKNMSVARRLKANYGVHNYSHVSCC